MLEVFEEISLRSTSSAAVALAISVVMLAVFAATLVSKAARSAALEVMEEVLLAVFAVIFASNAVMLIVFAVTLVSNAFSAFVALVVSAVIAVAFEEIKVGNVAMVEELMPPTLVTVEVNVPKPPPVTSPVNSTY